MKPAAMKDGKLYSQQPHSGAGDFNFSRADGVQTRINKHGLIEAVANNEPRLSYDLVDGKVGDCPHLLLEPSRTNLVLQSENFNTTWFDSGTASGTTTTITSDSTIAPDGTQTADLVAMTRPNTTAGTYVSQQQSTGSGVHIGSVYLKAKDAVNVGKQINLWQWQSGERNMVTITLTDYWKRYSTEADYSLPSGTNELVGFGFRGNVGTDTDVEFYVWGAQGEQGIYPTSYIPTSGSTETRQADICNGSGNSEAFNDSEGVLFLETSMLSSNPNNSTFQIDDGTSTNRVRIRFTTTTNQINGLLFSGVSGQPNINYTANDVTNQNKVAIRYQVGQIDLFVNGTKVGTSTGNATPTGFDNLSLGTEGKVKELSVFNEALTDEQLQLLTTP